MLLAANNFTGNSEQILGLIIAKVWDVRTVDLTLFVQQLVHPKSC